MGPRSLRRAESDDDLTLYPTEALTPAIDIASAPIPAPSVRAAVRVDPSWIVLLTIATVSAISAFVLVRSRVAPPRAATSLEGTLTVETRPAAANLFVDGQPRGVTPLTLSLQPGAHTLTLRYVGAERTVLFTVTAGQQLVQYFDFDLKPAADTRIARLSIVTDPPGARVTVDGRPRGVSPVVIDDLSAAEHRVAVTSGTGSAERRVTLDPGATKDLVFSLPRSAAAAGGVSVTSPFPVELLEHGELVGTSGTTKVMLTAGRHDIVLRNASIGYESRHTIDVVPGSVANIGVAAPEAPLHVNAVPWADILVDGSPVGQTPLGNLLIPVGPHSVTFRHPELGERTLAVVVTVQGANRVAVDFTR